MNIENIFTVKNEDLSRLDADSAVVFFQKLLWAEARRIGVELSKINISRRVNVRDGGIDATVNETQIETGIGIIKAGKTSYQIKSGKTKPNIKNELFGKEDLKEGIQTCLNTESTYVLVCTGIDFVDSERMELLSEIKAYLRPYSEQPEVEVWSQNTLVGFLESFPSLALWVNEKAEGVFQTYQSWSQDGTMRVPFHPGQSQDELIPKIQSELREKDNTVHVRVLGEPGIGKTKLVLEATRTDDLSPLVIYCTASQFRDSILMNEILRDDNPFSAILVIDECDADNRFYIWNKLQHRGPRIKLVSIYNESDPIPGSGISEFETERLDSERILTIIQGYGIPEEQANLYLQFCDGSPRMAHHTGEILRDHPGDPSQLLNDDYLYRRFYVNKSEEVSSRGVVEQRELVLQYIALFKRFEFGQPVITDAKAIAEKIREADNNITWSRFQKIVDELKKRKILQGGSTLYITPKALQIKLWVDWWQIYGNSFELEDFTHGLTPKLVERFHEMFRYARESEASSKIVEDLLGPNGPFQNSEYLNTREGSRFFLALTEANPKSALKCLRRTIGTCNRDDLLQFTIGRRDLIWALEKIAIWRELFIGAARLLLALGEAENEPYSNNASSVFASLFSHGTGRVAPTEASPTERLPVLKETFESNSKERRALALKACNAALESEHFSREVGAEYQGLRRVPKLWEPETYGELWDAYRQVWQLLSEQLTRLPQDERKKTVDILLAHAGKLGKIPDLSNIVVDTVITIAHEGYVNQKEIIETTSRILYYDDNYGDNLPIEIRQRFERLRDELVGSDFHSLMQRYVGMDLLEDKLKENEDGADRVQPHLEILAQQASEDPTLLQAELSWLVTTEAKNGYKFGYELGKIDKGFCLLPTLLDAQRNASDNASVYFLGGYFRVIFEKDLAQWEKQLDALIGDTTLNLTIPDLTHRSGLTDRAGSRILNLAKDGIIGIDHFGIYVYGKATENLSEEVFTTWIEFLLSFMDKSAVSIALSLYHRYYDNRKPSMVFPRDLTFQLLTHPILSGESEKNMFNPMTDYHWTEIGKVFVQLYREKNLELAEIILAHFGQKGSIVNDYSRTCLVLTELTRQHPTQVWKYVRKHLEARDNFSRMFSLEKWLREGDLSTTEKEKGAITLIPREKIWEWVDDDVENRAKHVAHSLIPKKHLAQEWKTSLARAFFKRYGMQENVRRALMANYLTGTWAGPASSHYEVKKQQLLRIKLSEDDKDIKLWIDDFVDGLE
ncbi:hypothetical protein F4167_15235, partial [Candidatus Poribacteria bacterium]|nr:hypothetical protein [Candidatus Poribacteria bacterium]